jgi:membrane protein
VTKQPLPPSRPRAQDAGPRPRRSSSGLPGSIAFAGAKSERHQSLERTVDAVRSAAQDIYKSPLPQMAAALAFRTIFSLIPVLVVALIVYRAFTTEDQVKKAVANLLDYSGISKIAVPETPPPPPPSPPSSGPPAPADTPAAEASPPDAAADGASQDVSAGVRVGRGVPANPKDAKSAKLDEWIEDLVQRAKSIPLATIGWIGVATLIYAALGMLVEVERAFNQIYRAPVGRSWTRRLVEYWALLTLGSVALLATFVVGEQFKSRVAEVFENLGFSGMTVLLGATGFVATVAISTLLLLFAYLTVPNTRVRFRPALVGAFIAAVLWETGKWGFTQYLTYSASYARLYGSLALIPLFLLWVYVTWLIVLLGLQVSYLLQTPRSVAEEELRTPIEPIIVDPAAVLAVLAVVARRFRSGEPADACEAAERTGLREALAHEMLGTLADAGLLHRVEKGKEEGYFALAKPPEDIQAADVLRLGQGLTGSIPAEHEAIVRRVHDAAQEAVKGKSLAQLMTEPPPTTPAQPPSPGTPPSADKPMALIKAMHG